MEDLMKNVVEQVIDSATSEAESVVLETVEETVAETGMADNLALDTLDVLLDTGAAEGIAALFGAPVAVVIGLRFLKKYRAKGKGKSNATS